jgi:hypothetical protein
MPLSTASEERRTSVYRDARQSDKLEKCEWNITPDGHGNRLIHDDDRCVQAAQVGDVLTCFVARRRTIQDDFAGRAVMWYIDLLCAGPRRRVRNVLGLSPRRE